MQGGSQFLHDDTTAAVACYCTAGHVEIIRFLCGKKEKDLNIFHQDNTSEKNPKLRFKTVFLDRQVGAQFA